MKKTFSGLMLGAILFSDAFATNGQGFITFSGDTAQYKLYQQDGSTWNAQNTTALTQNTGKTVLGNYWVSAMHTPPLKQDLADLFIIDVTSPTINNAILHHFYKNANDDFYVHDDNFQAFIPAVKGGSPTTINNNDLTSAVAAISGTRSYSFTKSGTTLTIADSTPKKPNTLTFSYSVGTYTDLSPILDFIAPDVIYNIASYPISDKYSINLGKALQAAFLAEDKKNYVVFGDYGLAYGETFSPAVLKNMPSSTITTDTVTPPTTQVLNANFVGCPGSVYSYTYTQTTEHGTPNTTQTQTFTYNDEFSDFAVITTDSVEELINNDMPVCVQDPMHSNVLETPSGFDQTNLLTGLSKTFPLPPYSLPMNGDNTAPLAGFYPATIPNKSINALVLKGKFGVTIPVQLEQLSKYFIYVCSGGNYKTNAQISFRFKIFDSALENVLKTGMLNVTLA